MPDRIRLDIDIINIRFKYVNTDMISDIFGLDTDGSKSL